VVIKGPGFSYSFDGHIIVVVVQLLKTRTPTIVNYHLTGQENYCTNLLMMIMNPLLVLPCSECQFLPQCTQHLHN
jgi:hypothetical protein